jgi:hypothetical protein
VRPRTTNDKIELCVMALAETHRGIFTVAQASALGWDEQRIHRRLRSGRIRRLHFGVYAFAAAPQTWEQAVLASVLAAGAGAVASHGIAAAIHGFPDADRPALALRAVSVPPDREPRPEHVPVHRVLLPADHVTEIDGIPVTTYERTLVDSTAMLSLGQLARALDHGIVTNRVGLRSMQRTLDALPAGPGRRPSVLRKLLAERAKESEKSESTPEIRVLSAIRAAGLPMPTPQYWVTVSGERFRLDAAYPSARLGLEYQGWDPHRSRSAFDKDYRRDRLLSIAGWTVLYFTSACSNDEIAADVTRLLHRSPHASAHAQTPPGVGAAIPAKHAKPAEPG